VTEWISAEPCNWDRDSECVELAALDGGRVGIRSSLDPDGPVLTVNVADIRRLFDEVRANKPTWQYTGRVRIAALDGHENLLYLTGEDAPRHGLLFNDTELEYLWRGVEDGKFDSLLAAAGVPAS